MECVRRFIKAVESNSSFPADGKAVNSTEIDDYLRFVARTGKTHVPWKKLKGVIISRVSKVIDDFFDDQSRDCPAIEASKCLQVKDHIVQCLLDFNGIPFTVQRLAELVVEPRKNYRRVDKFLRALEKNVMVITTIDPLGNRIVTESQQNLANSWSENSFHHPSPSSRVRKMSVDEIVDASNVSSPQMVAAAMMPPPPSPPPFSPKQQKSPLPVEAPVDNIPTLEAGPCETEEKVEDFTAEDSSSDSSQGKSPSKKPVIIWHTDGGRNPEQITPLSNCSANDAQTTDGLCNEPAESGQEDVTKLASDEECSSPCKLEPLPKRQRFNEDGCADCDSTTPDNDSSATPASSSVAVT